MIHSVYNDNLWAIRKRWLQFIDTDATLIGKDENLGNIPETIDKWDPRPFVNLKRT